MSELPTARGSEATRKPTTSDGPISAAQSKKRPSFLLDVRGDKKVKMNKRDLAAIAAISHDALPTIDANDLRDVNWEERNRPSADVTINLRDVSKDSKKKHQINWLAMDVRQKELQLLEKSSQSKSNQRSKTLKYGW